MNEFDIDKLVGQSLKPGAAGEDLRARVLKESTAAFVRGRVLRRRLQVGGLTLGVLLVAVGAFICGQIAGSAQSDIKKGVVGVTDEQEWTNVPSELVAWLDAGRFFERLGMDERAERAYKKAGELIPQEAAEIIQAQLYGDRVYAGLLAKPQSVERYREVGVEARCGIAEVGALDKAQGLNGILSKIIGRHLGG
ncbi:MAG: hypothetical protein ACYSX1_10420 [Planctomycetota bacterium]|jgi:hypothetical protein